MLLDNGMQALQLLRNTLFDREEIRQKLHQLTSKVNEIKNSNDSSELNNLKQFSIKLIQLKKSED